MTAEKLKISSRNLSAAVARLGEALAEPKSNKLAVDGTIQRFEFALELTWKTLKRLLAFEGVEVSTPREAMRSAYGAGWLNDETSWLEMLRDRNLTSHICDEDTAREIYQRIKNNYPNLEAAAQMANDRINNIAEDEQI